MERRLRCTLLCIVRKYIDKSVEVIRLMLQKSWFCVDSCIASTLTIICVPQKTGSEFSIFLLEEPFF